MTIYEVYQQIAESSIYGNLGLLIGAGFSKAFCVKNDIGSPLTWIELLQQLAITNSIDLENIEKEYKSCPETASIICSRIASKDRISYSEAEKTNSIQELLKSINIVIELTRNNRLIPIRNYCFW